MVYATLDDVRDRYELPIPDVLVVFAETHLADANVLLGLEIPTLDARIVGGLEPRLADLARMAVVRAVLRVIRNPAGYRQEHVGERSYAYREDAAGEVAFTAQDLSKLQPAGQRSRVRSVGMDDDAIAWPTRFPWDDQRRRSAREAVAAFYGVPGTGDAGDAPVGGVGWPS